MKKLAYIDLETSGIDCDRDEAIRFTAIILDEDKKTEVFDKYAKPCVPLSVAVSAITGITNDELVDCESSESVKAEFIAKLEGATVVGYNLDFDEKMLGVQFAEKIEINEKQAENTIEDCIVKLKALATQGGLKTSFVQKALNCTYPTARNIVDAFNYPPHTMQTGNSDKLVFEMDKKEQADYLSSLVMKNLCNFDYDIDVIFPRLRFELERIKELNYFNDFIVAKSIVEILKGIDNKPHFLGIGCCSLIAHVIGITGSELEPISHGLIFERGFQKGRHIENVFGFFVEDSVLEQLTDELKKRYGENVALVANEQDYTLSVNGAKIRIECNIENVQKSYSSLNETMEASGIAVFQEDYMRLLHYASGISYDIANEIRKAACTLNKDSTEMYKKKFAQGTMNNLPYVQMVRLYDEIVSGIRYSPCKAYYLSAKQILDDYYPF